MTPGLAAPAMAPPDHLRLALAIQAYAAGTVRLVDRSLAGCSHLVATRRGLFAVSSDGRRLLAYGQFFGITVLDDQIFAFEACDKPGLPTRRGRIIWLRRDGDTIVDVDVLATGLDNGCHQIDVIDDRLCVLDTYNQQIFRYRLDGGDPEMLRPIAGGTANAWSDGYAHVNSLIACGPDILLMLHNGAAKTGRPSEIARLDRDWRLVERLPIDGLGCHGFAVLEDGAVLSCGSLGGELISTRGLKMAVCDMMTRGLSVGSDEIVVGASAFAAPSERDGLRGAVIFLDRAYRRLASVEMPAPTMEVRRIDGQDRSLSGFLASIGATGPSFATRRACFSTVTDP